MLGNPHYWLDPANGLVVARSVSERLGRLDPANAAGYRANLARFESHLQEKLRQWEAQMAPYRGTKVVAYHNSWPNFAKRFGLVIVDFVEPKPGVPPSPGHVEALIRRVREEKVPLLMVDPFFDVKLPQKIAKATGAQLVVLPHSVGANKEIVTYSDLFDYDLKLLTGALERNR